MKIVGYGNPFRRDDAIGIWIVSRLKYIWRPPLDKVDFWIGQQLVPELSEWIHDAEGVIFIDSSLKVNKDKGWDFISIREDSASFTDNMFHSVDVQDIIALTKREYKRSPDAYLLVVAGYDFSFGAGLTEKAKKASLEAIEFIKGWIK